METINFSAKDVKLMLDDEKLGTAVAAISRNPNVAWLKMVVSDDKPNANGMRIPKEEFPNFVKTAVYMPVKMAEGAISEGHDRTVPIGSIAHLIQEDDQIIALSALWTLERPEDVQLLKDRYENGQSIDVSWELNYDVTASARTDAGILELRNVEVNAITIVGIPAYMGRTPVTGIASTTKTGESEDMTTILREDHEKIVQGLQNTIEEYKTKLADAELKVEPLESVTSTLTSTKAELDEMKPKYDELVTFKAAIDTEKEKVAKTASIRAKFVEAGIEITDEYFAEREKTLLEMAPEQLDFFIQELVAFRETSSNESAVASVSITSRLPAFSKTVTDGVEAKDVLSYLEKLDTKTSK